MTSIERELKGDIHDLIVAINTVKYCYERNPKNFAWALTEAQRLANEISDKVRIPRRHEMNPQTDADARQGGVPSNTQNVTP